MELALLFTRGVSLKLWVDSGLFDREKLMYEQILAAGDFSKVLWLTYGVDDVHLAKKLKESGALNSNIKILNKPSCFHGKWGDFLYSLLIPIIHFSELKHVDVFKSNQIDGAWSALCAKLLFRKKLYLRTGYITSQLMKAKGNIGFKQKIFKFIERFLFRLSDYSSVASKHNIKYLEEFGCDVSRTKVIVNYIDVDLFRDMGKPRSERFVFVGRIEKVKNLDSLIKAVASRGVGLDIYGAGSLKRELEDLVDNCGADVKFMGTVDNSKLPEILNTYKYYIQVSLSEGMPKTLLEAMGCGCFCLGTNVLGINEVINSGENGLLANGTDVIAIDQLIAKAITTNSQKMIRNGAEFIKNNFSIFKVVKEELNIYEKIL